MRDDDLLTAADAAPLLGISERTLQHRAARAHVARIGGRYVATLRLWRALAEPRPVTRGHPRAVSNRVE